MKSAFLAIAAAAIFCTAGCHHHNLNQSCGCRGGVASHGSGAGVPARPTPVARLPQGYMQDAGPIGPPTAHYAYPYYTTRAPRDFLQDNPMGIGP